MRPPSLACGLRLTLRFGEKFKNKNQNFYPSSAANPEFPQTLLLLSEFFLSSESCFHLRKSQKNISDFKNVCCCVLHRLLLRFPQLTAPPKFASVKPPNFSSELFPKFTPFKMNFDGVFILVFPP